MRHDLVSKSFVIVSSKEQLSDMIWLKHIVFQKEEKGVAVHDLASKHLCIGVQNAKHFSTNLVERRVSYSYTLFLTFM